MSLGGILGALRDGAMCCRRCKRPRRAEAMTMCIGGRQGIAAVFERL